MPDCAVGDIKNYPVVDNIGISKECSWRIGRGVVQKDSTYVCISNR